MLHTKFCGNRSIRSRAEDFLKVFTIYGYGGHIVLMTWIIHINCPSSSKGASTWKLALIGQAVPEEMFAHVVIYCIK